MIMLGIGCVKADKELVCTKVISTAICVASKIWKGQNQGKKWLEGKV
jgi:hypothetical protein